MDYKMLTGYFLFSAIFLIIQAELYTTPPSCVVNFNDCSYHFQVSGKTGKNCPFTVTESHHQSVEGHEEGAEKIRERRSVESPLSKSDEFHKMKRRLQRVEQKLSKSMESLSTRVLRGVRRMEDTLNSMMGSQTKRYAEHPQHGQSSCPSGFLDSYSLTSCYMFSSFNTSWSNARHFCEALDSNLLALDNIKEHNLITFIIKNSPVYSQTDGWWTSGTFNEKTKQWIWISSEMRPFTFIKWAANEPNEDKMQCVYLRKENDHLWHDATCIDNFNFVCEKNKK